MYNVNQPEGLYDPSFERDACGVGFVCNLHGEKSHDIVRMGLDILFNLEHRGACGCDENTGDGAGILIQVPHAFLKRQCEDLGISLPEHYGVGMVFLPEDAAERRQCMEILEGIIRDEGQIPLGWREVPTNDEHVGLAAKAMEPAIWQVFVGRGAEMADEDAFNRKLYVIRKVAEHTVAKTEMAQRDYFYLASLSSRTIVYKGMLTVAQLPEYYPDLSDPLMTSALAMVHSRFSTNTTPRWRLAHPFRFLSHNGEINTLRGNVNGLNTRQGLFHSDALGEDTLKLVPILTEGDSDSAALDNALELLYFSGRSLPHAVMMLIPEAWQRHKEMSDERKAFYEYHACFMEAWDGPATVPFTDGRYIGAVLDRNGLRPSRYTVTRDGLIVMASETGVLDLDPASIIEKGRLQPGRMFLVDLEEHRIISDDEIKDSICGRKPYRQWINSQLVTLSDLPSASGVPRIPDEERQTRQQMFGYTLEDLRILMPPMGLSGKEALGSMGDDTPLAVLSDQPRLLYDYFKQLFAQVTNPPLDAIREELVTAIYSNLGTEQDLLKETPEHCRQLRLDQPILTDEDLAKIRNMDMDGLRAKTLPMVYDVAGDGQSMKEAIESLSEAASQAVDEGYTILILSDRDANERMAPIPALLATAGVHHHLNKLGKRTRCGLVVESGEPREVHHFCVLIGFGAGGINPYLALDAVREAASQGELDGIDPAKAEKNYIKAAGSGILKVMSKMGISTLHSYRGAQIFEAVGLGKPVIDRYFPGTPSRLGGIGVEIISEEVRLRHERAYPKVHLEYKLDLDAGGRYQWRRNGEHHLFNPLSIAKLQQSVRARDPQSYTEFAQMINDQSRKLGTLRGMLEFSEDGATAIPLDEVEPWTEIVKRFKTGAMSYGSISQETHETLAIAMNRIGGRSNTGEGGEDPSRYGQNNPRRSRIKQVASGRFGVTISYLASADEIQIKMAQGAKPGEGGQLPGEKVYPWIARTRHSTPYVGLISPPPHHDIYSIEDLAQLIHDLKNSNKDARISVKLVSEVGVGTVAAGVAKGKADVVLISGYDGGTGASPQTSIMHAGLPWELGLSETHQTLVRNGLRSRIKVECDGQLKTGRDVAVAALLGADEFGFATAPLVALGCIMMRKCHLNTCPVGIATQNPALREKFAGTPEHVVNYLYFVAEELRRIMAKLGFRTLDEMVGRVDKLKVRPDIDHWKARSLDLSPILYQQSVPEYLLPFGADRQDHGLEGALDNWLIKHAQPALEDGTPVSLEVPVNNTNRALGTMLSHEVAARYGEQGLPDDTIVLHCTGSAGQSFMAFGSQGITAHIEGDANDYFGKGLSGGKLVIYPPSNAGFVPEENIIIGNVAMYGATRGEVYIRGRAGERFCVRNSGVKAVVEGIGDHGCEYMTGGRVVILGTTGRNFAAGMSGGVAYVLDHTGVFADRNCNMEMVELEQVTDPGEIAELRAMIDRHHTLTGSTVARQVLDDWHYSLSRFVKVMPIEYRLALQRLAEEQNQEDDLQTADVAA